MSDGRGSPFVRDEQRILLTEDPYVFLFRCGEPELETRFADIFRCAWGLVPPAVLAAVRQHWQNPRYLPERLVIKPLGVDDCGRLIAAQTQLRGNRIEFDQWAVRYLPDKHLTTVILHELAHVYSHAIGDEHHKDAYESEEQRELAEDVVRKLLEGWGFGESEAELDRWLEDNAGLMGF